MERVQRSVIIDIKVWKLCLLVKNSSPYTNINVKDALSRIKLHLEYRIANGPLYINSMMSQNQRLKIKAGNT